jgi:hypothetical protein
MGVVRALAAVAAVGIVISALLHPLAGPPLTAAIVSTPIGIAMHLQPPVSHPITTTSGAIIVALVEFIATLATV